MVCECEHKEIECDLRDEDEKCIIDTHPMEICPAEEEDDEEED